MELLGGVALALLAVLIVGVFALSGLNRYALRSPGVAAVVSAILVELANGDRVANALGSLTVNPRLVEAAQAKANDMAARGYFAHASPEGLDSWYWFEKAGYEYDYAGENLAMDFSDSGAVERAWMASPTHRDNILNGKYTEIGIATADGVYLGRTTTFVVQMFGASSIALAEEGNSASAPAYAAREEPLEPSTPPALAEVPDEEVQVLGSSVEADPLPKKALVEEVKNDVQLWGYVAAFPRDTLRYAYYILGFLILLALMVETGLEIKWHHRHKAVRAGLLLASMAALFIVADYAFFAEPVLALVAGTF